MYTARKTEIGKLRTFERELTTHYAEAVLRKHWDDAQAIWNKRRDLRRAILRHEEWNVDSIAVDDGQIIELPAVSAREEELAEELALAG